MNHTKWVLQKYPVNACGVRDGLSVDMLVSLLTSHKFEQIFNIMEIYSTFIGIVLTANVGCSQGH